MGKCHAVKHCCIPGLHDCMLLHLSCILDNAIVCVAGGLLPEPHAPFCFVTLMTRQCQYTPGCAHSVLLCQSYGQESKCMEWPMHSVQSCTRDVSACSNR